MADTEGEVPQDVLTEENLSAKEKEFQKAKSYLLTASTNTGINL